ncbi:uncharacterized protein ACNLHF_022855 [Anomaloglossus baeobatrachus]
MFEVFGSNRRTFMRCRTTEKMLEECLTPSVKHGGSNVMVWGFFGVVKVGDLYKEHINPRRSRSPWRSIGPRRSKSPRWYSNHVGLHQSLCQTRRKAESRLWQTSSLLTPA